MKNNQVKRKLPKVYSTKRPPKEVVSLLQFKELFMLSALFNHIQDEMSESPFEHLCASLDTDGAGIQSLKEKVQRELHKHPDMIKLQKQLEKERKQNEQRG